MVCQPKDEHNLPEINTAYPAVRDEWSLMAFQQGINPVDYFTLRALKETTMY